MVIKVSVLWGENFCFSFCGEFVVVGKDFLTGTLFLLRPQSWHSFGPATSARWA